MTEKIKYVHIGMPKNLSTTLQRDFFSKHPEIMHLGVGINSNVGYVNSRISSACENHFQYSNKYSYKKAYNDILCAFDEQFEIFQKNSKKNACGISLELLSFSFTTDHIDIEDKAKRIYEVFGNNTRIILIIREQFKLIESLYREVVKIGFHGSFKEYLYFIYYLRDRNFIFNFDYSYLVDLFCGFFGAENVSIIPMEFYRTSQGELIYKDNSCLLTDMLCTKLGLSKFNGSMSHHNNTLSDAVINQIIKINKVKRHGIGNQLFGFGANFHRLKDYLRNEIEIEIPDEILYNDVKIKNANIDEALRNISKDTSITYEYPIEIRRFLESLFKKSNHDLQNKLNFNLPEEYF